MLRYSSVVAAGRRCSIQRCGAGRCRAGCSCRRRVRRRRTRKAQSRGNARRECAIPARNARCARQRAPLRLGRTADNPDRCTAARPSPARSECRSRNRRRIPPRRQDRPPAHASPVARLTRCPAMAYLVPAHRASPAAYCVGHVAATSACLAVPAGPERGRPRWWPVRRAPDRLGGLPRLPPAHHRSSHVLVAGTGRPGLYQRIGRRGASLLPEGQWANLDQDRYAECRTCRIRFVSHEDVESEPLGFASGRPGHPVA